MSSWLVWAVLAITVLSYVLALVARFMQRRVERRRPLSYDYAPPQPAGLVGVTRAMGRMVEGMTWGSSLDTWRRRCDASLKASRRRRGLEP